MIWPCIKCSFVAAIVFAVVAICYVFGALCTFWGAAGNHNYTQNEAHKNTLCACVCLCAKPTLCVFVCMCALPVQNAQPLAGVECYLAYTRIHTAIALAFALTHTERDPSWRAYGGSHCCSCRCYCRRRRWSCQSIVKVFWCCLAVLKRRCCASVALHAWWGAVQIAI